MLGTCELQANCLIRDFIPSTILESHFTAYNTISDSEYRVHSQLKLSGFMANNQLFNLNMPEIDIWLDHIKTVHLETKLTSVGTNLQ